MGGGGGKRVDQIKASKVAPFQRGGEKKEETRDYAPTEPGTQLLRYYFTPVIESRVLNAPLVLSIFFLVFVCRRLIFLRTRRFSIKASKGDTKG